MGQDRLMGLSFCINVPQCMNPSEVHQPDEQKAHGALLARDSSASEWWLGPIYGGTCSPCHLLHPIPLPIQ